MKRTIWAVFLLAFFALPSQGQFEASFNRLFKEGMEAMKATEYSDAISHFLAASRADRGRSQKADSMVLVVMELIEQQRIAAEKATRAALNAKKKSDQLASYFFSDTSTAKAAWAYGPNGKFAVIDRSGKRLTNFIWDEPQPFIDRRSIAKRSGVYVFLDEKGAEQSEGYDWIHPTELGFFYGIQGRTKAITITGQGEKVLANNRPTRFRLRFHNPHNPKAGKWGILNTDKEQRLYHSGSHRIFKNDIERVKNIKGRQIINIAPDGILKKFKDIISTANNSRLNEEDLRDLTSGTIIVRKSEKWGVIDSLGNEVIPFKYEDISDARNGFVVVRKSGKWGVINIQEKMVIPFQYDQIKVFFSDKFWVKKGEVWGVIHNSGQVMIIPQYQSFTEFTSDKFLVKSGGSCGILNSQCELKELPNYQKWEMISMGKAWVNQNGKWGIIDSTGKEICQPQYEKFDPFDYSPDLIKVQNDNKWGLIDTSGKEVIPPKYLYIMDFNNGVAEVLPIEDDSHDIYIDKFGNEASLPDSLKIYDFFNGKIWLRKNGKLGLYDMNGREIIYPQFDIVCVNFREKFADVTKNGKWGLVNENGQELIPCQYDAILPFGDSVAMVVLDKKYQLINSFDGKILSSQYHSIASRIPLKRI